MIEMLAVKRRSSRGRALNWASSVASALLVSAALTACDRQGERAETPREAPREGPGLPEPEHGAPVPADSSSTGPLSATPPAPRYVPYRIDAASPFLRWAASLGPERRLLVLKLNRIDLEHARQGDTLAIPESFAPGAVSASATSAPPPATIDELAFAPLPLALAALDSAPKLLAISRRVQAFGAYERGRLVRWGPTSTGKKDTPTPDGFFNVNWQAKETISTEDSTWVLPWYANFETRRGLSIHQYALPGYPASHACVRLIEADAMWLYDWAEQWLVASDGHTILAPGTPILIFGDYAYGKRRPWRRLFEDPLAASVGTAEIDSALAPYVAKLREQARERERE